MCADENYLYEPQYTRFKRTFINFVEKFKEFNEDTKKQLNEFKEKKNLKRIKCLSDAQEYTNTVDNPEIENGF